MSNLPPSPKAGTKRKSLNHQAPPPRVNEKAADDIAAEQRRADLKGGSSEPEMHRMLPQNVEAEKATLCSFLLMPNDVAYLLEEYSITAEHFQHPGHVLLFKALMDMRANHKPIDFITLTAEIRARKEENQVGGAAYITETFTMLPTAANARYYIEIVDEQHTLREIIKVCTNYATRGYDERDNPAGLLAELEQGVLQIGQAKLAQQSEYIPTSKAIIEVVNDIEETINRGGQISGIPTGFIALDRVCDGLHRKEMFVIGARPSMGKTAIAMNIVEHIAIEEGIPVGVFSLEMSTKQLLHRATTSRAHVNWAMARQGHLNDRDYPAIAKAATEIGKAPIYINDKSGIGVAYIAATLRRWVRDFGIQVAMVDYLQLVTGNRKSKDSNREREVAEISSGLKAVAKDLNLALIVLAQINRSDQHNAQPPKLHNLRESGAIEQDADAVGLLHRAEYYMTDADEIKAEEGKANLHIAKQRNGPVGNVPLTFIKEWTRFTNRAMDEPT